MTDTQSTEKTKDTVRLEWLHDVEQNWGTEFVTAFEGAVSVTKLWQTQKRDSTSEGRAIPMPPVPEEELEE